ncbi:MAG: biotin--[acetyl-CoA-carboxylase] ligase [Paracoccaceae bacterium]|jgi:BirA family biotin operon repressor/biotin-[acetyl-CoA-carboxylase] ligase|nr:biotin--[acetyl-CoA-carboxylase] ligase [Paracoccaceae bacterium]MDO7733024.1 biotin--[acetyl-CoA-carboxylase] ligase [Paracoccaceae bacterium]
MGWPNEVGRHILGEIGSTNDYAETVALRPAWVMAHSQSAGRGRRGRHWESPTGNFYASYIMETEGPVGQVALRSFVAALALYDSFCALNVAPERLALKWPNDVLLDGCKVSGILLQSGTQRAGVSHLIVGFGVNLKVAPNPALLEKRALAPISVLAATGFAPDPETFLTHLAQAFAQWENQFHTQGFAALRHAWLARAAHLGKLITARTAQSEQSGIFETIDDQGALLLRTDQGLSKIAAADIYFDGVADAFGY